MANRDRNIVTPMKVKMAVIAGKFSLLSKALFFKFVTFST